MTARTLLLRNATLVAAMDDARREIVDGGVFVRGNIVEAVGPTAALPATADDVIDVAGHVVLPGLVNTHHHLFQTLTRAVPAAQDAGLFAWLRTLYPMWARMTPEMLFASAQAGLVELLLSGCTTSSDHLYVYPNGSRLDDTIFAAREIGARFHACRGAMSVGESNGGLPPDALVEDEDAILADTRRVIETFHDPAPLSMCRVAVAPCSPFSVSRALMRETALLAASYGVGLHTHLAENDSDVAYSREHFGCTPAEYADGLGWTGPHAWHAHCVKLDAPGIDLFARTRTGVAHCPTSNMRLASGIAPVRSMLDRGVAVGLGVDGSASNDGSHLLAEARQALLAQRVAFGAAALSAREALWLATRGGAQVLNRDDIGQLAPGKAADIVAFDLNAISFAGAAEHDPLGALVFCAPAQVALAIVDGKVAVRDGALTTVDARRVALRQHALARELARCE
ncbi:MAG TPA: 8-oxoguanine deaminase [Casimicrobiaceae bacterium]|nr:8-oxoguanine deaminase [Casimicrobiaceae bacterium]